MKIAIGSSNITPTFDSRGDQFKVANDFFIVVIMRCIYCMSTDIMDDIEDLILAFMMQFIVQVLIEYESSMHLLRSGR